MMTKRKQEVCSLGEYYRRGNNGAKQTRFGLQVEYFADVIKATTHTHIFAYTS